MRSVSPFPVALALTVIGCSSAAPRPPPPEPDPPEASEEPEAHPEVDCPALDRFACMESTGCTLVMLRPDDEIGYACRPVDGSCEQGLAQRDLFESPEQCSARSDCTFRPDQCYCACRGAGRAAVPDREGSPECDCECAGGPPPMCGDAGVF
ncbi:MAG: hypothetical protein AAGF12_12465 [Myxococcota bacterium]